MLSSTALRYLPFMTEPRMLAMGLGKLDQACWIEPDEDLAAYHANKLRQRALLGSKVYAALPQSAAAQLELSELLLSHLLGDHAHIYQRSGDIFLGVPFNIASYALLLEMLAHVTGYAPGDFVHTMGDAHIYSNHMEQVQTQLARTPKALPQLKIKRQVSSIFDFTYDDFEFIGYDPDAGIKAPVAV